MKCKLTFTSRSVKSPAPAGFRCCGLILLSGRHVGRPVLLRTFFCCVFNACGMFGKWLWGKMRKKPRATRSIPANLSWKEATLRCIRLWLFPFADTSKARLRRTFCRPASDTLCVAGRPSGTSTCIRRCRGNTCWFLVAFAQKLPRV